jgi:hypothetical protein
VVRRWCALPLCHSAPALPTGHAVHGALLMRVHCIDQPQSLIMIKVQLR